MQLRETKILPLANDQWSVEMTYSDDSDPAKAKSLIQIRKVFPAKPKHPIALYQREAITEFVVWAQDEAERLRLQAF